MPDHAHPILRGHGLHEGFDKDDPTKYSRRWFAWVNNLYGEMIIKVLRERPQVLAKPIPNTF